ncbi:MAG: hypothetical protein ACI8QC_003380 [Planctomycetota bacterium]
MAALVIVPQSPKLVLFSVFAIGIVFFWRMAKRGVRRLSWLSEAENLNETDSGP